MLATAQRLQNVRRLICAVILDSRAAGKDCMACVELLNVVFLVYTERNTIYIVCPYLETVCIVTWPHAVCTCRL